MLDSRRVEQNSKKTKQNALDEASFFENLNPMRKYDSLGLAIMQQA